MTPWKERGGRAPINQLSTIQECRVKKTYEVLGCIPSNFDYPHNYSICRSCFKEDLEPCLYKEPPNNCSLLADHYNQPCDSWVYHVEKEQKPFMVFKPLNAVWADKNDGLRLTLPEHDCSGSKIWKRDCSTIEIDIPFDRFEISNMTYNPKYESLELFSVIGGYLGMWLGISLLTVVDILVNCLKIIRNYLITKKKSRVRAINKSSRCRKNVVENDRVFRASYSTF